MSPSLIYTILTICAIALSAAIVLFFVAKKFHVEEDPRIDDVEGTLPGANCGGCGYAGCRAFAEAIVTQNTLEGMSCPVGGAECMEPIAQIMGLEAESTAPRVAVVRCNGCFDHRPRTNNYEGANTCAIASMTYSGETNCQFGCLGLGDCAVSCDFDAISMDESTGLPVIDDSKCVSCGACVKACPKLLIEVRRKMPKDRKILVSCQNKDKGAAAKKACSVACIGCKKCVKECKFDAITVENNLAFIDSDKCKLCRKCVTVCPTNAIIEENFPPRKVKPETPKENTKPVTA